MVEVGAPGEGFQGRRPGAGFRHHARTGTLWRRRTGYAMHSGGMLAGWKFSNFKDGVFGEYFHVNDADGNLAHAARRHGSGGGLHDQRHGTHRLPRRGAGGRAVRRQRGRHRHRPGGPDVRGSRGHPRRGQHLCGGLPEELRGPGRGNSARPISSITGKAISSSRSWTRPTALGVDRDRGGRRRQRHLRPGHPHAEARAACIGNVNYLGEGDYIKHPAGGVGLRHGPQDAFAAA